MRDRTADLLDANQALSQLSYSPIYLNRFRKFNLGTKKSKPLIGSDLKVDEQIQRIVQKV